MKLEKRRSHFQVFRVLPLAKLCVPLRLLCVPLRLKTLQFYTKLYLEQTKLDTGMKSDHNRSKLHSCSRQIYWQISSEYASQYNHI